jgi:hypothetical protein
MRMIGGERHDRRPAFAFGDIRRGHPLEAEFTRHGPNSPRKSGHRLFTSYARYIGIFAAQKRAGRTLPWSILESPEASPLPLFALAAKHRNQLFLFDFPSLQR